mgnify:CR=1 FL=1
MGITSILYGQSHQPIEVFNAGELVFSASEDSVVISGVFPITMTCNNYYTHQYDNLTNIHYFGFAMYTPDGCDRFDQEFSLWCTEDLEHYFYNYTDTCEGIILYKGDSKLAEFFRSENQYPTHDIKR